MVLCNLRNILAQHGISQRALARHSGVHRATIRRLCDNDWMTVNRAIMDAICQGLRITPQEFLIWENEDD